MTDLLTIEARRQFSSRKEWEHSFDFDNSRKIARLFRNDYRNKSLNSKNGKRERKIRNDRNSITETKNIFQKKAFFRNARIRKLTQSFQNNDLENLIANGKATYDEIHVTLLFFSRSNILNLLCQKRKRYEMNLLKNKWRFARHMNALKQ